MGISTLYSGENRISKAMRLTGSRILLKNRGRDEIWPCGSLQPVDILLMIIRAPEHDGNHPMSISTSVQMTFRIEENSR